MGGTICRASREPNQVSKALLWLPWYFVNRFLESTRVAEETLGKPPTCIQIFVVLRERYGASTIDNV